MLEIDSNENLKSSKVTVNSFERDSSKFSSLIIKRIPEE